MKPSQVAFGRKNKGSGNAAAQSVFGKNMSGGPKGRKTEGQTSRPKGRKEPNAYSRAHSDESSFDDGYMDKLK